jgi:hypothetical protein
MLAYVQLATKPNGAAGSRSAIISQGGELTVRFTEVVEQAKSDRPSLWLEAVAGDLIVDSFGCFEHDGDELATAVEFVCRARNALARS